MKWLRRLRKLRVHPMLLLPVEVLAIIFGYLPHDTAYAMLEVLARSTRTQREYRYLRSEERHLFFEHKPSHPDRIPYSHWERYLRAFSRIVITHLQAPTGCNAEMGQLLGRYAHHIHRIDQWVEYKSLLGEPQYLASTAPAQLYNKVRGVAISPRSRRLVPLMANLELITMDATGIARLDWSAHPRLRSVTLTGTGARTKLQLLLPKLVTRLHVNNVNVVVENELPGLKLLFVEAEEFWWAPETECQLEHYHYHVSKGSSIDDILA